MINIENNIFEKIDLLNKRICQYKKIFGENSLDYVIICEPNWIDIDNFNNGIKKLENAIESNKPIKPIPKKIWKNIIF